MSARAEPVSPLTVGGYAIDALIGRGGSGSTVYRASHPDRPEPVALKVIAETEWKSEAALRFRDETRLARSVAHRHILPVYETGKTESGLFVAMMLSRGGDLGSRIGLEGRLAPERAVAILRQIAGALDAAHSHGLVHGDVKPANVLLDEIRGREHAYIADFGAARVRFAHGAFGGAGLGTAGYSAPEQVREGDIDTRTDVYALGCLFFECLTGRLPFERRDGLTMLWAHLYDQPPAASSLVAELPDDLDAVIECALAKSPEDRFPSAGALAVAAEAALARPSVPGPRSFDVAPPGDRFFGRAEELGEAARLVAPGRVLTVTGPGGAGKTRFAVELSRTIARDYRDGVVTCFLASLRNPDLFVTSLCRSLGVRESPGRPALYALADHLQQMEVLLVLDNVEHLQAAAGVLHTLLAESPRTTMLATSRELLQLPDEHVYELPPLTHEESVDLFCDRSGAKPGPLVDALCERLDGLPLAIELAAARIDSTLDDVSRLSGRLDLVAPSADVDPRQETLRATIQWSYDLLAEEHRTAFARLSVFAGSWTAEGAARVAGVEAAGVLGALAAKSLVRVERERYTMLETIRQFASEQLGANQRDALRSRHASWLAELLYDNRVNTSRRDRAALELLDAELANVGSAFEHALARASVETALRLWVGAAYFWLIQGRLSEGDHWGRQIVELSAPPTELYGKALGVAGEFPRFMGDLDRARELKERAIAVLEQLPDDREARRSLAASSGDLVDVCFRLGRPEDAEAYARRALAVRTELGEVGGIAHALGMAAQLASRLGRHDEALQTNERAEALWLEANRPESALVTRISIGYERRALGDFAGAGATLEAALAELPATALGELAWATSALGLVTLDECQYEAAASLLAEGQERARLADWSLDIDPEIVEGLEHCRTILGKERFEAARKAGAARATERFV